MSAYSAIKINAGPGSVYGTRSHAIVIGFSTFLFDEMFFKILKTKKIPTKVTVDFENKVRWVEKDRDADGVWQTRVLESQF